MPTKKPGKDSHKLTEKEINEYIDGIYNGTITEKNLSKTVYDSISKYLEHGVFEGYGMDIKDAYGSDLDLLNQLRENVFMFGAAKDYQMTKEISSLLIGEDGELRTNKEFNAIARETYSNWNDNWGETEYSTAVGQAYAAQKWNVIEQQKSILPNLRYSAISDPCDICEPLDGMVAPVDDPIWNKIAPLNHFNCRCILVQEDEETQVTEQSERDELEEQVSPLMQAVFRSNPGKDGMIFNESHPFFKDIPKEDREFAKDNFNLPLPEPVVEKSAQDYKEAKEIMKDVSATKEQAEALDYYTGTGYGTLNTVLRSGKGFENKAYDSFVNNISSFLETSPKCNFNSFRGLEFNEKEFNKFAKTMKEGTEIADKGFMSTSALEETVKDTFLDGSQAGKLWSAMIEVEGKNGVLIEKFARNANREEGEILFNKGTKFKILNVEKKGDFRMKIKIKEL